VGGAAAPENRVQEAAKWVESNIIFKKINSMSLTSVKLLRQMKGIS